MKAKITWILVADGGQARVFENDGPGKGLAQVKGLSSEEKHLRDQDIVTDRPGRTFSPSGSGQSGIQPRSDPVEQRETRFVQGLARMLHEKLAAGAFDRLIIAAAPTALGDIRPALSASVNKTIVGELHKDLTNTPTNQIAAHFDAMLAI